MNKLLLVIIVLICCLGVSNAQNAQITRQGEITFFSYTSVEDIKADNNQVLSLFYPQTKKIGVEILMRAFTFEKSLMYEHFNESYIESDLYPKAIFQGEVVDFDFDQKGEQTRLIKGSFTLRDITIPVEFKGKILEVNGAYVINGSLGLAVDDFNIRIPALLAPNIAKNIQVSFNFEYMPYDDQK
jgi:hypothetical protein